MPVPDPDKPRCLVQSKTPGFATLDEAIQVLAANRDEIGRIVSMPAQDHLHCALSEAISSLRRLRRVERQCAERGHKWVWSPFCKPPAPPLRERVCSNCYRREMPQAAEYDGSGREASIEEWDAYYGRS